MALIEWNTASNLTQTQTISCCPARRQQGLQLQSLHSSINVISSPNFKMWFVMEMLLYAKKKKICGEWGQISWNLLYWVSLCREMRARVTVQTVSVLSSTSWGNWPSLLPYTHTHAHNVFFIFYFFLPKEIPSRTNTRSHSLVPACTLFQLRQQCNRHSLLYNSGSWALSHTHTISMSLCWKHWHTAVHGRWKKSQSLE